MFPQWVCLISNYKLLSTPLTRRASERLWATSDLLHWSTQRLKLPASTSQQVQCPSTVVPHALLCVNVTSELVVPSRAAVCSPTGAAYQCRCEESYAWSSNICVNQNACDDVIGGTCGCLSALPADGQYCQRNTSGAGRPAVQHRLSPYTCHHAHRCVCHPHWELPVRFNRKWAEKWRCKCC